MVELVKRYKVVILLSSLLIINLGVLAYQSNKKDRILLTTIPSENKVISQEKVKTVPEEDTESLINSPKSAIEVSEPIVVSPTPIASSVPVYVCGAVKVPGVYYVGPTAIVDEAIRLSGGFSEEADQTAINLAASIVPNEKISVPKIGEEIDKVTTSYDNTIKGQTVKSNLININTASSNELMALPGIGEVKAQAIIDYRETVSAFRSIEELKEVSGIGDKTFEKLKALITV